MINKHSPLVSVVIPAYNAADYLREAIDSVLSQEYPNIELIVLDDGSTDHAREILESYPEDSFYWESHVNMGQAATLNKGWSMARGEMLGYLSADDLLDAGAVAKVVAEFLRYPDSILVYGNYHLIDSHSHIVGEFLTSDFDLERMLSDLYCPIGPGAFFSRSVFDTLGGWNEQLRLTPDFDYWLRIAGAGKVRYIPDFLARWRIHEDSQTMSVTDIDKADEMASVIQNFFLLPDIHPGLESIKAKAMASSHIFCAGKHLQAGRVSHVWLHLQSVWRYSPQRLFTLFSFRQIGYAFRQLFRRLFASCKAKTFKNTPGE